MPAEASNSLIQVATPLAAAVIGAIFGGIFTFASTYYIQRLRVKRRKKRLRRAFVGELRLSNSDAVLKHATKIGDHLQVAFQDEVEEDLNSEWLGVAIERLENSINTNLKSDVYDENLSSIGIFDTKQIDALLRYYHVVGDCKSEFKELKYHVNNGTLDGGDAEFVKFTASQLDAEKTRLLEVLNASEFKEPEGYADIREMAERKNQNS